MAIPAIVWQVVTPVLRLLLSIISPLFKRFFEDAIRTLYSKALTSPNPADDAFVEFLAGILGVDLTGVTPAPIPISDLPVVNAAKGSVDGLVAMANASSIPSQSTNNPPNPSDTM